jgi:C-5 cytosine-specific DNA methylase
VDLLAGGVPCPSFTIAANKLGAMHERALFAWAIELGGTVQPLALMLENIRGLSLLRFAMCVTYRGPARPSSRMSRVGDPRVTPYP